MAEAEKLMKSEREIELNESRPDTSLRIFPRMKSLLVIKPSSLGDIVHGLQVMQTMARAQPELRISWVVRERFAGLVQAAPFVAETLVFQRRKGWRGLWAIRREIRARRFDAVWDLQGLLRSGLMTAWTRAPEKWGRRDAREGAGFFYNRRVSMPAGQGPHHALEILLRFVESAGVKPELSFPLELKADATFAWQSFFAGDPRRTFVIFTDSRGPEKTWLRFFDLMQQIWATIPESRIAWCAGPQSTLPFEAPAGRFLNLTGCPLAEMIALVRQPSVFVGNDSGPMHLSAASGNRVLAIFGPTSPRRFGPFPLESPRHLAVEAPGGKLAELQPAAVLTGLRELCSRS
jgi:ADP-heptose:LPS heptosyltransferase